MQGLPVKFDQDGLLPAYFAGVSGVYSWSFRGPGTSNYKLNGSNYVPIKMLANLFVHHLDFGDGFEEVLSVSKSWVDGGGWEPLRTEPGTAVEFLSRSVEGGE